MCLSVGRNGRTPRSIKPRKFLTNATVSFFSKRSFIFLLPIGGVQKETKKKNTNFISIFISFGVEFRWLVRRNQRFRGRGCKYIALSCAGRTEMAFESILFRKRSCDSAESTFIRGCSFPCSNFSIDVIRNLLELFITIDLIFNQWYSTVGFLWNFKSTRWVEFLKWCKNLFSFLTVNVETFPTLERSKRPLRTKRRSDKLLMA